MYKRQYRTELPGMLATLCSYEDLFGPRHPQTLRLMAHVAIACREAGELDYARPLLERAVRDLGRFPGGEHDLRLRALAALRDLFAGQGDFGRAGAVQREILECQTRHLGADHAQTLAARACLATTLLKNAACDSGRKS